MFSFTQRKIMQFLLLWGKVEVFQPYDRLKIVWDFLNVFFIFIGFIFIPVIIFFDLQESDYNWFLYNYVLFFMKLIFLMDILVNLNTAYYKKGGVIEERTKIAKKYLRNTFIFDFLAVGSFIIFTDKFYYLRYFLLFFFLKLFVLFKKMNKLEQILVLKEKGKGILDLGRLVFFVFMVAHIFACIWHKIGMIYKNNNYIKLL